mmetsp:Transcript_53039/g.106474  ORF Transcript_53039/g.106474 Transcript_53039/m.106474 type:complete len:196 (-) Transcript_53039:217-804(-)
MASTAVATQPDDRLHHELEAEQQRTCDELEAKAIAWIEAHPVFEMSYTAPMVCAGEFLPELYTCSWKSLCVGMRFKRAIQEGDSAAELQDLVESVSLERVEVPDLEVPAGWSVTATPSHSSFKPGEDGQAVRMKSFDGETLRWKLACAFGSMTPTTSSTPARTSAGSCTSRASLSRLLLRLPWTGSLHDMPLGST